MKSGQFVPYLSGISAQFLSFSRDGDWTSYVAYPEGTLWRSKVDGSQRLQLTFPPMNAYLPRWSPDGTRIAFQANLPGKPWKMCIISADGGSPQEVMEGQGNIGWSPDGNSVVFSDTGPTFEPGRTGPRRIYLLDLRTHQVTTVAGSDGLYSPRWSPDRRYFAALRSGPEYLVLFDFETRKWDEVAKVQVGCPSWSHDGKSVYL